MTEVTPAATDAQNCPLVVEALASRHLVQGEAYRHSACACAYTGRTHPPTLAHVRACSRAHVMCACDHACIRMGPAAFQTMFTKYGCRRAGSLSGSSAVFQQLTSNLFRALQYNLDEKERPFIMDSVTAVSKAINQDLKYYTRKREVA